MKRLLLSASACLALLFAKAQWVVQDPGFRNDTLGFYEMSLPDKNTAWAVCYDAWFGLLGGKPILDFTRTTDGGTTWIPGKMGTDRTLRFSNVSAIDGNEAWVAMHKIGPVRGNYEVGPTGSFSYGGGIFHTEDGGTTWEHTSPGELFDSNSVPRFVHFKDKNHGIAVGDPNGGYFEIYITNNKGKKWKRLAEQFIPAPLAGELGWISGHAVVGDTIWFGTSKGRMYKSIDFGKTWSVHVVDPMPGTLVHEIAFLDDGQRGVAHLRNPTIFRTYVYSTTDGGRTWTNYNQPPNWKNSRMTAVPGTNAFISTAVHGNPLFQGSAISYDVGKTWTQLENSFDKAVCRFYDATTGYAGGFYIKGHPVLGVGGMFKSTIIFEQPLVQNKIIIDRHVQLYPMPANDVINISLEDNAIKAQYELSIISMSGNVMETRKMTGRTVQLDVSRIPSGMYTVRITGGEQTYSRPITIAR
jgi:photosystem II stability/assembly factor-like uncharacterized protein